MHLTLAFLQLPLVRIQLLAFIALLLADTFFESVSVFNSNHSSGESLKINIPA